MRVGVLSVSLGRASDIRSFRKGEKKVIGFGTVEVRGLPFCIPLGFVLVNLFISTVLMLAAVYCVGFLFLFIVYNPFEKFAEAIGLHCFDLLNLYATSGMKRTAPYFFAKV